MKTAKFAIVSEEIYVQAKAAFDGLPTAKTYGVFPLLQALEKHIQIVDLNINEAEDSGPIEEVDS